jgi:2-alkenal reductase
MKHSSFRLLIPVTLLFLLALACNFTGSTTPVPTPIQQEAVEVIQETPQIVQQLPSVITDEDQVLIELYNRVNPAVVNIITYIDQSVGLVPSGQGSGFVYDLDGHIVTNAHVIHGADDIEVIFTDNTIRRSEIIGEDLHSDLAVIRVDDLPAGIEPLNMGDINSIAVGQTVVAIGNPFGLGGTLTRGIVSALGRTIPALTPFSIPQAIQTDAPINPGNSGGPLLNLEGQVIGVNAQIETDGESRANSGVGFAIPISIVNRVIPELISQGKYEWAWLGVRGTSLTPAVVEAMDLPFDRGAYMIEVIDGGPSDKANLQGATRQSSVDGRVVDVGGDVITAIQGQSVYSFEDLLLYITLNASPGQDVNVTIWRDGDYQDITIQLEERPETDSFFPVP